LPWFEIFYKILNYTHELASKLDEETMETILMEMYQQPVPLPNEKLQFSPVRLTCANMHVYNQTVTNRNNLRVHQPLT